MIIETIFDLFMSLVDFIIGLLPVMPIQSFETGYTAKMLSWGLYVFPIDLWVICISNIILWIMVEIAWSTFEWVYKKVPGVS